GKTPTPRCGIANVLTSDGLWASTAVRSWKSADMTANLVPIIDIQIETETKNDVVLSRSKPPLTDKVTTISPG
ncbi:hypothetical protein, partial [Levilactobacillus spicheri]|uniref:hypothetical protein n=1 Tax=Levilactobacillus spicheri TaxID=216463 RepID=UPI001CDBC7BB